MLEVRQKRTDFSEAKERFFLLTEEACPAGAAVVARWPVRLGLPRQLEQAAVQSRTGEGSCATGPIEEKAAGAAARVPQPPPILPRGSLG